MYQACVKALPETSGHLLLNFATKEERDTFCTQDPQVFWYVYAEDDALFASGWKRGSAWEAAAGERTDYTPEVDFGERW